MSDFEMCRNGEKPVSSLTKELLEQDIVAFYSVSVTNLGSRLVVGRNGYLPAQVDTYGTDWDGNSSCQEIFNDLVAKFFRDK